MTGPVEPMLAEVVLERDGRVVAAYSVRRDVRGDWVLLDQSKPQFRPAGGPANPGSAPAGVTSGPAGAGGWVSGGCER